MSDVVQKFWGFCHTLRHDGIDYGDYIEQITYLLFLKMADEPRVDRREIIVVLEHPLARDDRAELDVLAARTEEHRERKELFRRELRLHRILVGERLFSQIQELDRVIVAAQLTLHGRPLSLDRVSP